MNAGAIAAREKPFATLRRLSQRNTSKSAPEQCGLCCISLTEDHRHLLETSQREIICACDGCALSFQDVVGGRFQLIPRDTRKLSSFSLTDIQWEGLALPINLVFFFRSGLTGKITAMYPSPAGATESLLPLPTWETLVLANPILSTMKSDVEALLVNRVGATQEYYIAPIDVCYQLVGLVRLHWRGLSGGEEVWREIDAFFSRLEAGHA
jgi:Family of unknown function (DUF5947)